MPIIPEDCGKTERKPPTFENGSFHFEEYGCDFPDTVKPGSAGLEMSTKRIGGWVQRPRDASGQAGITTLYVMRWYKKSGLAPAEGVITKSEAELLVGWITMEGATLRAQLSKATILNTAHGEEQLNVLALEHYTCHHCCVTQGLLLDACSPRVRRRISETQPHP